MVIRTLGNLQKTVLGRVGCFAPPFPTATEVPIPKQGYARRFQEAGSPRIAHAVPQGSAEKRHSALQVHESGRLLGFDACNSVILEG